MTAWTTTSQPRIIRASSTLFATLIDLIVCRQITNLSCTIQFLSLANWFSYFRLAEVRCLRIRRRKRRREMIAPGSDSWTKLGSSEAHIERRYYERIVMYVIDVQVSQFVWVSLSLSSGRFVCLSVGRYFLLPCVWSPVCLYVCMPVCLRNICFVKLFACFRSVSSNEEGRFLSRMEGWRCGRGPTVQRVRKARADGWFNDSK